MSKPSEIKIKALKFIQNANHVTAAGIAMHLWPNSNMHTKTSNQGHGATRGKAAWLCGGSYLGKLKKAGLIRESFIFGKTEYKLTEAGCNMLADWGN